MIFRAVFWIGLVALLMPHEPDLGLGRPGAGTAPPSPSAMLAAANGLLGTDRDCGEACAGGLGLLRLNRSLAAGLADVKAQIEADRQARAARTQMQTQTL